MIIVGILFSVIIFAGIIYTLIKYFQFWKRFRLPKALYWIVQTLFMGMLILCISRITVIESEIAKSILLRISAIYFVVLVYSTVLILIRQLICILGQRMAMKNRVYKFIRSTKRGVGSILIFTFVLGIVSLFNMQYMTYTEYDLGASEKEQDVPLKIAAIADAHIGTAVLRSDLQELVTKINETKPDVIFLVGDMFDHSTSDSLKMAAVKAFSEFESTYGVYYVEGNHENYLKEDTTKYFREAGIQVLLDQVTTLSNGVQIAGRRDFADSEQLPLETVLTGVDPSKPLILLSHQPQEYKKASELGVDLVISGHTHGGQLWGNFGTYLANDMNYGMKKYDDMTAITTSGIGGWGVPAKLGFPSEVVVITM